ncbi:hypothetical protein NFI96_006590 [Prochilodus magdalenae]|nr:hypothetical protein NFI96_006590 [Prochilodus magdalenae]
MLPRLRQCAVSWLEEVQLKEWQRTSSWSLGSAHTHSRVYLSVRSQISFGGMPVSAKPSSGGPQNFIGCMEGIHYNGDNITSLARRRRVDMSSFVRV